MRNLGLVSSLSLVLGAAACSAAKAPEKPTWVDDVQPIIVSNCAHCHGPTAAVTGSGQRLDICDASAFADSGYIFMGPAGAGKLSKTVASEASSAGGRAAMPPAPAGELPSYEQDVLNNWKAINPKGSAPCGTRPGNHKPSVKLIGRPKYDGGGVTVTVEVSDADHDQVVGALFVGPDCDPTPPDGYKADGTGTAATECMMRPRAPIPNSGRHQLKIASGVNDGAPLIIRASDGWTSAVVKEL